MGYDQKMFIRTAILLAFFVRLALLNEHAVADRIDLVDGLCLKAKLDRAVLFESSSALKNKIEELKSKVPPDPSISYQMESAIKCAVSYYKVEAFQVLLDEGAPFRVYHNIIQSENKILDLLLERKLYIEDILERAAYVGNIDVARRAIEKGAIVRGNSVALRSAASRGHSEMVKFLIEQGAGKESPEKENESPIFSAIRTDKIDVVKLLLDGGADINATANYPAGSSLMHQVNYDNPEMVKFLVSRGANINARDKEGNTPLFNAAQWGHLSRVEFLISLGADPNIKNNAGKSPLLVAKSREVVDALRKSSKYPVLRTDEANRTSLIQAVHLAMEQRDCPKPEILDMRLKDSDVNHHDILGMTALHYAVFRECQGVAEYLLDHGAEINGIDLLGRTPADVGIIYGTRSDFRELLIKRGAQYRVTPLPKFSHANERDSQGNSELMLMIARDSYDASSVDSRLQQGADIHQKNQYGMTPTKLVHLIYRHIKSGNRDNPKRMAEILLRFPEKSVQ